MLFELEQRHFFRFFHYIFIKIYPIILNTFSQYLSFALFRFSIIQYNAVTRGQSASLFFAMI
jgi:hypothetical protein